MKAIRVENLSFRYAGSDEFALKNVDFSVEEGEFVVVTGPSGCGKTTLCRCLNGLIPHFYEGEMEGRVLIFGTDTREKKVAELSTVVGMVFQNPENQLFCTTVEQDVAFGLENLGVEREEMVKRVEWAMKLTGVYELRHKAPYELSGGQQQRVVIASVLAMQPRILVLDEPTSFLDPLTAKSILEDLRRLSFELGVTVFLVEHRLDVLAPLCDRVLVLYRGELFADGDPRDVLSSKDVRAIGVGIPKTVDAYRMLKSRGVSLPKIPLSVDEFLEGLRFDRS